MFSIKDFALHISGSWWLLVSLTALAAAIGYYYYKYSLSDISPLKKVFLRLIRFCVIFFILLLAFEPIAQFEYEDVIKPVHYIFWDRSKSNFEEARDEKYSILNSLHSELENSSNLKYNFYSFGDSVRNEENIFDTAFTKSSSTNFQHIFTHLKNENAKPSTVTILSDGIVNDGENPIYFAEGLNIPIYAVALGDTTTKVNAKLVDVIANNIMYAGQPSQIRVSAMLEGIETASSYIDFYEENKLITTSAVQLKNGKVTNVNFDFNPKTEGEIKLSFRLRGIESESNLEDNKKIVYVKILGSKMKVVLINGMPSFDQRFIKTALEKDTNIAVTNLTFLPNGNLLEGKDLKKVLDEADIIFLLNFPVKNTPSEVLQTVIKSINEKSLPFFFLLTLNIDTQKLKLFNTLLPITWRENILPSKEIQPHVNEQHLRNPILKFGSVDVEQLWNNLPVVYQSGWDVISKPESATLLSSKMNNIQLKTPLLVTRKLGKEKSILVNASDIWRWKMLAKKETESLFDNFFHNSIRWLSADEELKRINIRTTKNSYAQGEEVNFIGEVYDDNFNPIDDATINVKIKNQNGVVEELSMNSVGGGLYDGVVQPNNSGDYEFNAVVSVNSKSIGKVNGRFNVGEFDLELSNLKADIVLMHRLSEVTGGKFFYNNFDGLIEIISSNELNKEKIVERKEEVALWNNDWLLFIIIFLFGIEWFIRKREGLL